MSVRFLVGLKFSESFVPTILLVAVHAVTAIAVTAADAAVAFLGGASFLEVVSPNLFVFVFFLAFFVIFSSLGTQGS